MKGNNIVDNTSYTNKDFQSTYNELLDLVKKLTNKWDPSLSNESDPGVVLLKLNALVADKNNYNIDKNVLECFPASVTQIGNARQLYDLLGYKMNHYISAVGKVLITIKNPDELVNSGDKYIIPQFTSLTDTSGEAKYILLDSNASLTRRSYYQEFTIMEGSIHKYDINGSTLITLNNLDNNLRLYFPISQVAQNGIFIKTITTDQTTSDEYIDLNEWTLVDNLSSYDAGRKVYEFGVLNNGTCYIQFPNDISDLIGGGLNINYISSNGLNGNIQSSTLNSFSNDIKNTIGDKTIPINDKLLIAQPEAITNGQDPETLEEAYKNYKRQVGTFNTLVTRRDYENYIYDMKYGDGTNLVSNVKVTDRTNDINNTIMVQDIKSIDYTQKTRYAINNMQAQDMYIYPLNFSLLINNKGDYDSTFETDKSGDLTSYIQTTDFADAKSAQHDIKELNANETNPDKFMIKNLCDLNGQLITYYKITDTEKKNIEDNVKIALMQKYNSRHLVYGEALDYDEIIETIKKADARIKTVILDTPKYTPYLMYANNTTNNLIYDNELEDKGVELKEDLLARMILRGNTELFKFNDDFKFDFGELEHKDYSDIESIYTFFNCEIPVKPKEDKETLDQIQLFEPLKIKDGESIQILQPSLITKTEYSSNVRYSLTSSNAIPKNKDVLLESGQSIELQWTDSNGITKTDIVGYKDNKKTWINTNIDLKTSSEPFTYTLGTSGYIKVKEENLVEIKSGTKYYCYLKNDTSLEDTSTYILGDGEYFIYTDVTTINQIILGSGTLLDFGSEDNAKKIVVNNSNDFNLDIVSRNYSRLESNITAKEMQITSLGSGTNVWVENREPIKLALDSISYKVEDGPDEPAITLTNSPNKLLDLTNNVGEIHYIDENDTKQVIDISQATTYIRSKLDVQASSENGQVLNYESGIDANDFSEIVTNILNTNLYRGDLILIKFKYDKKKKNIKDNPFPVLLNGKTQENEGISIKFNAIGNLSGDNINAKVLSDDEYDYNLKLLASEITTITDIAKGIVLDEETNQIILTSPTNNINNWELKFDFENSNDSVQYSYIVPITFTATAIKEEGKEPITPKLTISNCKLFNIDSEQVEINDPEHGLKSGTYLLQIINNSKNLKFTLTTTSLGEKDSIIVGNIVKLEGFNNIEDPTNNEEKYNSESVMRRMINLLPKEANYNWLYRVPNVDKVENPLEPESYWDINHIYNQYTLPQINFNTYKIQVHSSSLARSN